jgi:catechol 2,3-dioxygenase-like lactoylglutathione lyase family enzyme
MLDLPFDHVAVVSRNMSADIEFYSKLGFVVEAQYEDWAIMRDGRGHAVALLSPDGKHPPHFGLRAHSREMVELLAREHGSKVTQHRDGSVSVYLSDPSGNAIEVIFYPSENRF